MDIHEVFPNSSYFKGNDQHNFADHQFCLKCGKWEGAPEADDCGLSHSEMGFLERTYGPDVRASLSRMYELAEHHFGRKVERVSA